MTVPVAPTIADVFTAVGNLLVFVVPAGTEVFQGIGNRVDQPKLPHVVITEVSMLRLSTPTDEYSELGDPEDVQRIQDYEQLQLQIDFYGPLAAQWAAAASTLFRHPRGVELLGPNVAPLYADDPVMIPLVTGEKQYLKRYMLQAQLQWNPLATLPQQFADTLDFEIVNTDERFPPS